ncbi:uncharacterized protein MONBRDRAFT_32756 [Monosiga brevicollis MX1]|uniref:U2A'/phosphoprotein 32 family A C-terminal domain-containing protein n=1 Tax=Monosiga brevicollis TaxID=81824 RepID=A9V1I9_MONBE|nr:uncharacterized protein MONBRDRAFT_32756 [Monosiga brevicollis MX1]EDQ88574.1 predicted protein [Monosiga brevicollis MX1]|eukprot:XP_001746678.1 hypothetical protein [Monosiga brevicollis MX1]
MGRLTVDVVALAPQFTNALKEREIDLRENKIIVIENLGATVDQFDTIDLSDNEIRRLEGFPTLQRLKSLIINNNRVSRIAPGLESFLPRLEELILTNNALSDLADLQPLFGIPTLQRLSLLRNPVAAVSNYRLYVIYHMPQLKMLDFQKVKEKERAAAKALFESASGAELLETVKQHVGSSAALEKYQEEKLRQEAEAARIMAENTAKIKTAIQNATSLEEVQRLEAQLRAGIMPGAEPMATEGEGEGSA